jgi:Zn-dependent protease with chaperone function/uncharacterized tellurite resistance protein B-like protein
MPTLDFFERQTVARRRTKWLQLYFALAIIGTVLLTYFAAACLTFLHRGTGWWDPGMFAGVAIVTLAFIGGASLYKISQLASGGSAVAIMLGGRPVDSNTSSPDERKLLNVVEEMAIASGTPVPEIYILPKESGINAFAAGHSNNDMVICATSGCLKHLTRDELQGVIGHEFSHILNGDMRLNLRLMGLVFGLICLQVFGRILLDTRDRKNPLLPFGFALMVIGSVGVFFGKLIKSAVSRQREFLADASSVQFTRNPAGLANALKKIGSRGSRINDPNAEDASHFFFANGLGDSFMDVFATHPPLADRIRALEPAWDGQFIPIAQYEPPPVTKLVPRPPVPFVNAPQLGDLLGGRLSTKTFPTLGASALLQVGQPTARHLEYAANWRANLPTSLDLAAREPISAVALIYALLLSRDEAMRQRQLAELNALADPVIVQQSTQLFAAVANTKSDARLPLAALTMTALRRLSPAQYEQFVHNLEYLIASDDQLELFEYALQKIVLRQLEPAFKPPHRPVIQFYVLKPLIPDAATLLSALAYAGQNKLPEIETAFRQGAVRLNVPNLTLASPEDCALPKVDLALNRLNQTTPQIKKIVLEACAETVAADGIIQESEAELLRAIADTLDCPIPPFLSL